MIKMENGKLETRGDFFELAKELAEIYCMLEKHELKKIPKTSKKIYSDNMENYLNYSIKTRKMEMK